MRIKLKKLKEVESPTHPNNKDIGYESIGSVPFEIFKKPEVGMRFYNGITLTSVVKEVLTKNTFETLNSIYEWEVVE